MIAPLRIFAVLIAAASGIAIGYGVTDMTGSGIPEGTAETTVFRDNLPPPVLAIARPVVARAEIVPQHNVAAVRPRWTLRQDAAVFDDLTNIYVSVPSIAPLRCGPRRRATLMLRCLEDRTAVYIAHDCPTPPGDPAGWQVDLRLDDGPVQTVAMEIDSLGEAIGHWDYPAARTFIEALLPVEDLAVRFTDATGQRSEMTFPVAGLAPHLDRLSAACHWSPTPPWAQTAAAPATGLRSAPPARAASQTPQLSDLHPL